VRDERTTRPTTAATNCHVDRQRLSPRTDDTLPPVVAHKSAKIDGPLKLFVSSRLVERRRQRQQAASSVSRFKSATFARSLAGGPESYTILPLSSRGPGGSEPSSRGERITAVTRRRATLPRRLASGRLTTEPLRRAGVSVGGPFTRPSRLRISRRCVRFHDGSDQLSRLLRQPNPPERERERDAHWPLRALRPPVDDPPYFRQRQRRSAVWLTTSL